MTRYEELRAALFPVLVNRDDIAEHPGDYTPGAGAEAEKALVQWRKANRVTAIEWHSLIKEYEELPF